MKKLLSITVSAILLIAAAATMFVSCKKELREISHNTEKTSEKTEAQLVYGKIVKFREAREAYHANAKTDNGYVSPSEARSILDGAINYEFSDVNRYLEDTELDTLRYTAPAVNGEGLVAVNDLVDIYDQFASNITNRPYSSNCFMVKYPTNSNRDGDVEIVFTRGNPSNPPTPPIPLLDYFGETDNWIWGFDQGKCIYGGVGDAAQELTKKCNAMLVTGFENDSVTNYYGHMYDVDYADKTYDSLQSGIQGLDYWLFHAENVPNVSTYCIPYDEMNLYLRSIYGAVIRETGCYHYSYEHHSPIRVVEILCQNDPINNRDDYYNISHKAHLTYYKLGLSE